MRRDQLGEDHGNKKKRSHRMERNESIKEIKPAALNHCAMLSPNKWL
jgi:hypothetical protein